MPELILTNNSLLLTPAGWLRASNTFLGLQVYGIDGAGHIRERDVVLSEFGTTDHIAYVGTSVAFGEFDPRTKIIDCDNKKRTIREIVESGDVGDLKFENAVQTTNEKPGDPLLVDMWNSLRAMAIAGTDEKIVLFCRGYESSILDRVSSQISDATLNVLKPNFDNYLRLTKSDFLSSFRSDFKSALECLSMMLFEVSEDAAFVFDRDNWHWGYWFASIAKKGHFTYDNLQHTTTLQLRADVDGAPSGLSKGGTAFFRRQSAPVYCLCWKDTSWSPLCSGFILAG